MLVIIIAIIIFLIIYLCYKLHYPAHYDEIQPYIGVYGPKPWPIIGSLPPLRISPRVLTEQSWFYGQKYGPIVIGKLFNIYGALLVGAEPVQSMLGNAVNLEKSRFYDFIRPWLGDGLITSGGVVWRMNRKLLTGCFHYNVLIDFVPIMQKHANQLVHVIRQKLLIEKSHDVCGLMTACSLDIIMETSMGQSVNAQLNHQNAYVRAIYDFGQVLTNRIGRPWIWLDSLFWFTPGARKQRAALRTINKFTEMAIQKGEREFQLNETLERKTKNLNFVQLLLKLKAEGEITHQEIIDHVNTFIFAGHDTTAAALSWAVFLLGHDLDSQNRARQEVQEILDAKDEQNGLSFPDYGSMKWLSSCIKETLRLYPSVPVVSRHLIAPLKIDESVTLPAGTTVGLDFYQLHRDHAHFPEPHKFDPHRFYSEEANRNRHPYAFCAFAAGPRNCIGQKFAMLEMKCVLSELLLNFSWRSIQSINEVKEEYQMMIRAPDGLKIHFQPLLI